MDDVNLVKMGRVTGVFGIKGWLKVYSETQPLDNILQYKSWILDLDTQSFTVEPVQGKRHGKGVIVKLKGYDDRNQAETLKGAVIAVRREQLADLSEDGEYYWTDLEGLQVSNLSGLDLGVISHLFETGSNDVMVVRGDRERLIPYIWEQVVKTVDLPTKQMVVDWDPDF